MEEAVSNMRSSYRPLGGYSPSIQPSLDPVDIADIEPLSRQSTPSSTIIDHPEITEYNRYRYSGSVKVPEDIEVQGFVNKEAQQPDVFLLYKRRWFGLAVLTLQGFAIGWGFTAPSVVAKTALFWYDISFERLNNLSIIGNFVFLAPAPFVIWVLNRWGSKWGIVVSCMATVVGNWVIYAGTRTHNFDVSIAGTIIHSLAAPFAICAPTRYARQWFGDRSRTIATAIPSLAYPLGAGFGAITGPYMVQPIGPLAYDTQAMIIAFVFTAVAISAPFLPNKPPSPPSFVAATTPLSGRESLKLLLRNKAFYLQFVTFTILAGAIDTATAVTVQATTPYGYSQHEGAIAIALLIFVGLGASLIVSPILDRTKKHEAALKVFVVTIALAYTALPWVPESHSVALLYLIYSIVGACSLSVEPAVLEFQASVTHPVSPEFSSVVCWCGCKAAAGVFTILVGKVLVSKKPEEGQPVKSLFNGLLFVAALAWVAVGCAMLSGVWIFKRPKESKVDGND